MGEYAIPYIPLDKTGKTYNKVAPGKTQEDNKECYQDDQAAKIQQLWIACIAWLQAIDSTFDNTCDCQLQKINWEQRNKSGKQSPAVSSVGGT